MRHIRCASCGTRYDYDIEGCCPDCGAYNCPPRRREIEADGLLHTVKKKAGAEPWEAKSAGKKVCYEEGPREKRKAPAAKPRQKVTVAPLLSGEPNQSRARERGIGKPSQGIGFWIVVGIVVISMLMSRCSL